MNTNETPVIKKYLPNRCLDIQTISSVWDGNKFNLLSNEVAAREVRCPICGGADGYYVPPCRGWSCLRVECLPTISRSAFRRQPLDMALFGVPESYHEATLEKCYQPAENISFFRRFAKLPKGFCMMFGPSGTGKTYASCAIIQEYRQRGDSCRFVSCGQLYQWWLEEVREGGIKHLQVKLDVELLVLDDFGTRAPSEAFLDFLLLLVNERSTKIRVGTIVSTNLNSEEIADDFDQRISSRICSGKIIQFGGADHRLQHGDPQ